MNRLPHTQSPGRAKPLASGSGGPIVLQEYIELLRLEANRKLSSKNKEALGQYLTPLPTARYMSSLFSRRSSSVTLLDAGSGVGSLSAAFVIEALSWKPRPVQISVLAYEIDPMLVHYCKLALDACQGLCLDAGIQFEGRVEQKDFIAASVELLQGGLFATAQPSPDYALLNPPFGKLPPPSRRLLQAIGIETGNLYAAFVWLASRLLISSGELVALTPRSFCNGTSFKPFRQSLFRAMDLQEVHAFNARNSLFSPERVLQEMLIIHAAKSTTQSQQVCIFSCEGAEVTLDLCEYRTDYPHVVPQNDAEYNLRIIRNKGEHQIAWCIEQLDTSLDQLNVEVSTGPVIAFRWGRDLRTNPTTDEETVPLIWPEHMRRGTITWPVAR